jgi:hypothetical protein
MLMGEKRWIPRTTGLGKQSGMDSPNGPLSPRRKTNIDPQRHLKNPGGAMSLAQPSAIVAVITDDSTPSTAQEAKENWSGLFVTGRDAKGDGHSQSSAACKNQFLSPLT